MAARKLNTKLKVKILYVSVPIVSQNKKKNEQELQDHQELCEEVSNLVDVAEVRYSLNKRQTGEALLGMGIALVNDHERNVSKSADKPTI